MDTEVVDLILQGAGLIATYAQLALIWYGIKQMMRSNSDREAVANTLNAQTAALQELLLRTAGRSN